MARTVAELEKEIRVLARELISATERAGEALDAAVSRLEGLDEELKRGRIEAREAVLRSGEQWPFELPSNLS